MKKATLEIRHALVVATKKVLYTKMKRQQKLLARHVSLASSIPVVIALS